MIKDVNGFLVNKLFILPKNAELNILLKGFTGSAGVAVVTLDKAALWTDGRYFIRAAQELNNTSWKLMKEGILKFLKDCIQLIY
jgi:hypothetical protein